MTTTILNINGFDLTVKGQWFQLYKEWDFIDVFYKDCYMFTDDLIAMTNYDKSELDFVNELQTALDKQLKYDLK